MKTSFKKNIVAFAISALPVFFPVCAQAYTENTGTSAINYSATVYPHQDCEIHTSNISQSVSASKVRSGNATAKGSIQIKCVGFGKYALTITDTNGILKSITVDDSQLKKSSELDCKNVLNKHCKLIGDSDGVEREIPYTIALKNGTDIKGKTISGNIGFNIETLIDNEYESK